MFNRIKIKRKKEQGVITLLIVFFIGLAVAAAFYSTSSSIKGYSDSSLTAHSLTQAQSLAWKADNLVNQYLTTAYCGSTNASSCTASTTNLGAIPAGNIALSGLTGVTATVVSNTVSTSGTSGVVTVNITASSGGATATLQSVHGVSGGGSSSLQNFNFNYGMLVGGNTTMNGALTVTGTNGSTAPGIGINGNLLINGGQSLNTVAATGTVTINGNNTINNLSANGSVSVNGSYTIGNLTSGGNFSSNGSGSVSNGAVTGTSSVPSWESSSNNVTTGATVPTVQVVIPTVNAYNLRSSANYILDLNNNVPSVYVQNVSGIPNGWYLVGSSAPDGTNTVVASQLCKGYSAYNNCLSYSGGQWTFSGLGFAPGIVWANGNILFNGGPSTYYDTFIATGNITENGSISISAFNLAPAASACGVAYYPTNLCTSSKQNGSTLANSEFIAGGTNSAGTWTGGNILLNGSGTNLGDIVAGSTLTANGNISIGGAVLVAGNNVASGTNALTINGSLALNLSPAGSSSGSMTVQTGAQASSANVLVKWVRYL